MDRKLLLHRKSYKHDTLRFPIFVFLVVFVIYLAVDGVYNWLVFREFLKEGFSGNGLWFIFLWIVVLFLVLLAYGTMRLAQLDKDEYLYLEGDELVYEHGKTIEQVKVNDVYEILILSGGLLPTRAIHFKTRNPKQEIQFAEGYEHALRKWITHEELLRKGMEIYDTLRKINPNIELKRVVPRKYRANKNAVMEIYEDGKWVPFRIKPWWRT